MKKSLGAKTIAYPTPVFVVGTYDEEGKPNIMCASWAGICCSRPPCMAVSLREATYTYGNVVAQEAFTISLPSEDHVREADYVGMVSGRDEDKFGVTGLTPVKSDLVNAPYVKEFPFVIECKLLHTFKLGLHTQFVGEIIDVKVDEGVLGEDGLPDLNRLKPILFAPENRAYHVIGEYLGKAFSIGREVKQP
jgi:flavin reductase (DIM6/NTAB) family NADH-FMN oxidoreductase RutF